MTQTPEEQADLDAYLAERDVPCPGCGYNLRASDGVCCPECGVELDERLLHAGFYRALGANRLLLLLAAVSWALVSSGIVLVSYGMAGFNAYYFPDRDPWADRIADWGFAVLVAAVAVTMLILRRGIGRRMMRRPSPRGKEWVFSRGYFVIAVIAWVPILLGCLMFVVLLVA